jgi:hypothetical protein
MENPLPSLLAILVCDYVIQEVNTHKPTIVGVFDQLLSISSPISLSNLGLYAKLADGHGDYEFRLRVVSLKDEKSLVDLIHKAHWATGDVYNLLVNIKGLRFPSFGSYEFQIFVQNVYLGRAVLKIGELKLPPQQGRQQ